MHNEFLGLDHMHMFVNDRIRAINWYEKTLNLKSKEPHEIEDYSPSPWIVASNDNKVKIAFFHSEGFQPVIATAIRVNAEQFKYWVQNLKSKGVLDVIRDHGSCYSIYFNDPFGHRLELSCYETDQISENNLTLVRRAD